MWMQPYKKQNELILQSDKNSTEIIAVSEQNQEIIVSRIIDRSSYQWFNSFIQLETEGKGVCIYAH